MKFNNVWNLQVTIQQYCCPLQIKNSIIITYKN